MSAATMRADIEFNNRGGVHEEVKRGATMASTSNSKMGKRTKPWYLFLLGTKRRSKSIRTRRLRTTGRFSKEVADAAS